MADTETAPAVAVPEAAVVKSESAAEVTTQVKFEAEDAPATQDAPATTEAPLNADEPSNGANGAVKEEASETQEKPASGAETVQEKESQPQDRNEQDQSSKKGQSHHNKGDKPRPDWSKNVKSDYTTLPETDDPAQIRKQVEFYFSDSNLANDTFLFQKVDGAKNLPVPIKTIHSFKRMQRFQPLSAVVAALKECSTLNLVNDDTAIQRKVPLAPDLQAKSREEIQKVFEDKAMARSVYVKGFGEEQPSTQFDIESFFTAHGPTNQVRLRRNDRRFFKSSVFVEFDSEETQKKFLALDPQPRFNGRELLIKSKKQYCDEKVDDIKAGRLRPNEQDDGRKKHHGRERDDNRDWRDRRDDDRKNCFRDDRDRDNRRGGHGGRGRSSRGSRGGGGGGGGRGGRKLDRNEERESKTKRYEQDKSDKTAEDEPSKNDSENLPSAPAAPTTTEESTAIAPAATPAIPAADEASSSSTSTKKRTREEAAEGAPESVAEEGGANKRAKGDIKNEE